jgi:hypothetical protein
MKRALSTLLAGIGVFAALAFAASDSEAQHRRHHHHGARIGVYIGAPLLFAPWPYYRPYYYDPYYYRPIVIQEQPVVYTEQTAPVAPPSPAPQAQQQYWYFCQDTQTYYPHVQNCATPWQRVIPHAPR